MTPALFLYRARRVWSKTVTRRIKALGLAIVVMLAMSSVARAQNYVIDQGTATR
jgi:hypothetical protein